MEEELIQLQNELTALSVKLADDEQKIKIQQAQKKEILAEIEALNDRNDKIQRECVTLERKQGQLQNQLVEVEAEREELSKYPEIKLVQQKIKDELQAEVNALRAELKQLKPDPQTIAPKVSAIYEMYIRFSNSNRNFKFFYFFSPQKTRRVSRNTSPVVAKKSSPAPMRTSSVTASQRTSSAAVPQRAPSAAAPLSGQAKEMDDFVRGFFQ